MEDSRLAVRWEHPRNRRPAKRFSRRIEWPEVRLRHECEPSRRSRAPAASDFLPAGGASSELTGVGTASPKERLPSSAYRLPQRGHRGEVQRRATTPFLGGRTLPLIVVMGRNKPAQTPLAADVARHPDRIDVTVPVEAALIRGDWLTCSRDPFERLRSRRPGGGSGVDVPGLPSGNETGRLGRRCALVLLGAAGVRDHDQAGCRW